MNAVSNAKFVLGFSLVVATLCFMWLEATPAVADAGGARTVKYSQQDIISVRAKLRFSTLIVLPQNEEILDYATGDKEFWIINGAHNLCYVHPAQAGIRSDLHLITSTGRVYSCRFVADPAKTPATLDLVPKDGKYPSPCIYKVAGDTLTIHYAVPAAERPTTFEPVVESKCILYVLKRVPPEKAKKGDPAQAEAERVADEALAKAKLFKDDENQEYYVKKLKDIVSNHPGTAAAREAQKLLNGPK